MTNQDNLFIDALEEFKSSVYFAFNNGDLDFKSQIDVCRYAVRLAYKDLQWRTIKNHRNEKKELNIENISCLVSNNICNKGNHLALIREVSKVFYDDFGESSPDQCFGKAQKVVNMSFKYLYCINSNSVCVDYNERDIPLDDRIFDFYYSYRKYKGLPIINRVWSWSNIKEKDYLEIQQNLKRYIKDIKLDMNPIEAEFIIWNYATAKLVVDTYESARRSYESLTSKKATIDSFEYVRKIIGE